MVWFMYFVFCSFFDRSLGLRNLLIGFLHQRIARVVFHGELRALKLRRQ